MGAKMVVEFMEGDPLESSTDKVDLEDHGVVYQARKYIEVTPWHLVRSVRTYRDPEDYDTDET